MAKPSKRQPVQDVPKRFDIFCPYCMRTYPANNVVFRKNNNYGCQRSIDLYLQNFYKKYRPYTDYKDQLPGIIDPAYLAEDAKHYDSSDILMSVRDVEGAHDKVDRRLCPYCHNQIIQEAGHTQSTALSVIGFKGSGKTTFEAALIDCLRTDKFGVLNLSLSSNGLESRILTTLEDNIVKMRKGSADMVSTQVIEGPYHYLISHPEDKSKRYLLSMVDLPGEKVDDYEGMKFLGEAIPESDTCVLLVDIDQISKTNEVLSSLFSTHRSALQSGKVNFAVVLYKADRLLKYFRDAPDFLTIREQRDYQNGQPVDMKRIFNNHQQILHYVVAPNSELSTLNTTLQQNLNARNFCWFAASAMRNGKYSPNNVEEPLLWSLALKGLYPVL